MRKVRVLMWSVTPLFLDDDSFSDTVPYNVVQNSDVFLQHEATVSKISEEQLFIL